MAAIVRCERYGPDALLLRFAEATGDAAFRIGCAIIEEIERNPPVGLIEWVPGFTTMLLRFRPEQRNLSALGRGLTDRLVGLHKSQIPDEPPKEIPVVYDGEDLESLAEEKKLSIADVIRLHSEPIYKVYFLGFAPGFPYLGELNPILHTPRRHTPRPFVSAGSVAIGGEHTGVYPVDSPGGWHVIGHTSTPMFDHEGLTEMSRPEELFFLKPGDRLRFVPISRGEP